MFYLTLMRVLFLSLCGSKPCSLRAISSVNAEHSISLHCFVHISCFALQPFAILPFPKSTSGAEGGFVSLVNSFLSSLLISSTAFTPGINARTDVA